ncbi:DUF1918 domain-containing protein [Actinoplanes siamensis]|uniref:DUF1918 domain-containing protein n=1 Tax=Actinoplanes siamensis TaxID=1223317 RepID=A0A919K834_9ACTN|nr:DUF1918 domain-containing protein [Actinoplanes siamensis]GIF02707.1 hypothetical protein Asi03nite_02450 [Actinoplanes siamensis]
MKAKTGDHVVIEVEGPHGHRREGVITVVGRADGLPPYQVHWLDDGNTTLLFPGPTARIEPGP